MAYVATDKFYANFTLIDKGNKATSKLIELVAADFAEAVTAAQAIAPHLAAVTYSVIAGFSISSGYNNDAFAAPTTGNINGERASISLASLVDSQKVLNLSIPNPIDGIFLAVSGAGYDVVDGADTALLAFLSDFQTGGNAYLSDGQVAGAFVRGIRVTRASRRNG